MRTELKIGVVLGILVVLGVVVFLTSQADKNKVEDELPLPLPAADVAEPGTDATSEDGTAGQVDDAVEPLVVIVDPPARDDPCVAEAVADQATTDDEPAAQERQPRYHVVVEGDSLWGISEQWYGHGRFSKVILAANRTTITDENRLRVGWKLRIPYPDEVAGN